MNEQAHMSGQMPNQGGPQLSGISQQNGSLLRPHMQSPGTVTNMDPDLLRARKFMLERITQLLQRKRPNQTAEWLQRLPDVVRRLEEWLFKDAATKEEYINIETLESRLHNIMKNIPHNNQPSAHHISSSSSVSTMIPTPGLPQNGNMNLTVPCSMDTSVSTTSGSGTIAQTTVNIGNIIPTANGSAGIGHSGSFNASDGPLPNGYQRSSANISIGAGANNMLSSMGVPTLSSQMIPTPGLNNPQSTSMNSESIRGGGFSGVESVMVQQQQKQYVHNSRILHSLGGHMGLGLRSNIQHKPSSYGFPNGVMNGGLGLIGNNMQLVNGPASSEGYLSVPPYGNSPKLSQQHFAPQHHQQFISTPLSQQMVPITGDGYGMNAVDISGSGNLYGPATTVGSIMNNQNMSTMSLQSKSKTNPSLLMRQPTLQSMQQTANIKPPSFDESQKINFQSPHSTREHLLQPQQQMHKFQQQQQFQQQPNQPYAHFIEHQQQQKQQTQQHQQLMLRSDTLRQSSLNSSVGGQLMPEHGMEVHNGCLLSEAQEQFHLPELHGQYQQNIGAEDHSKSVQMIGHLSGAQDLQSSFSQGSKKMHQILHPQQQVAESQNEFHCLSTGSQAEALLQGQWHQQPLQKSHVPDQSSFEQHIQADFNNRIIGRDEAQRPQSSEGSIGQAVAAKSFAVPQSSSGVACGPGNTSRQKQYVKQQRWILFLRHARRCSAPEGKCQEINCIKVQQLLMHMDRCNVDQCAYPRCCQTKTLMEHHRNCQAADCPVCVPVHAYIASYYKALIHPPSDSGSANPVNGTWKVMNAADANRTVLKTSASSTDSFEDLQSSLKRMKVELPSSLTSKSESSPVSLPLINQPHASQEAQAQRRQQAEMSVTNKEVIEVKTESFISSGLDYHPNYSNVSIGVSDDIYAVRLDVEPVVTNELDGHVKQETMQVDKERDQAKLEAKQEVNAPSTDSVGGSKSGKPKIKGVSLTELFTPEQIREHITGLRQWVGQSKAKAEKNQAMEHSMSENSCQLCAVEKLTFEPPPIYCTPCGARIKRNAMYYTAGTGETRYYFCIPCYNEARGDTIDAEGHAISKARLEKKKNDEETEEWWVQCDKCEAWQHQICALFNGRRNDGGQAEYTCPNCYVKEIENGERKPLPQSAVLGAKDLPRTILSDHIEQRLSRRLKHERQERARHLGKSFDEVPGADALVIRVVSSVDKKLDVKQRFLEIFQEENYPTEFPYKSKVILLFQKIEGVEVCLFGMYVQEFGSECQFPNQRRVYLSYLDSVKYFRPDTRTVTGEALRTFVYHEILIGYLEYCKKRGFTSCYIWACPPLKGEDYILYCHPEIQKTPKSDKLREWYLSMLRKASKENIVVELTNLYDHFFVTVGECKAKITAARLPYFDGDYWPGAAEDMINQLQQEEDGRKQQKKGKKTITKRALKAAGQADLSGNASKDALLMQKLGETISPMKEDFIMVHLQHACSHCCLLMVSGTRWVCNQCKNFQLCEKCRDAEQKLDERDRHPMMNSREKHVLNPVEINDVLSDTKDKDEILESEFFDTRQAFLSLCQGNHYQYDTLRRAKHSSMMVLYHLHNPTAPAFVTTCNVCHHDIETGQGWRCEVCPDFDVCNSCYQKDGAADHPHKLTNHPSMADRDAQSKEARAKRVLQLRKMLDLLVHASKCRFPQCQYPNCRKVKGLFRHGMFCKIRASGGCLLCKKMWYLLQLHARACKESECSVPRCKDLREHLKRLQHQSDSRRRAAVMEMMRQRAAEVAGNSG